jgi:hypothetical protein
MTRGRGEEYRAQKIKGKVYREDEKSPQNGRGKQGSV